MRLENTESLRSPLLECLLQSTPMVPLILTRFPGPLENRNTSRHYRSITITILSHGNPVLSWITIFFTKPTLSVCCQKATLWYHLTVELAKVPVVCSELLAFMFVSWRKRRLSSGMPSRSFVGKEVASNSSFGNLVLSTWDHHNFYDITNSNAY